MHSITPIVSPNAEKQQTSWPDLRIWSAMKRERYALPCVVCASENVFGYQAQITQVTGRIYRVNVCRWGWVSVGVCARARQVNKYTVDWKTDE
jgi:hypothetical protein